MRGIDRLLAESNDRWSRAMRNASGVEDLGLGMAVKNYYTRYFPGGALVLLVSGTWVGSLVFDDARPSGASPLSVGFLVAGIGAVVGGFVYNSKKVAPAVRLNTVDALFPLDSEERKSIRRQIVGRAPVDVGHLPVVRAGAVQLRKSLATQLVLMPWYLFFIAFQISSWTGRGDAFAWIMAGLALVMVVALGFAVREFRQTTRFLAGSRS